MKRLNITCSLLAHMRVNMFSAGEKKKNEEGFTDFALPFAIFRMFAQML